MCRFKQISLLITLAMAAILTSSCKLRVEEPPASSDTVTAQAIFSDTVAGEAETTAQPLTQQFNKHVKYTADINELAEKHTSKYTFKEQPNNLPGSITELETAIKAHPQPWVFLLMDSAAPLGTAYPGTNCYTLTGQSVSDRFLLAAAHFTYDFITAAGIKILPEDDGDYLISLYDIYYLLKHFYSNTPNVYYIYYGDVDNYGKNVQTNTVRLPARAVRNGGAYYTGIYSHGEGSEGMWRRDGEDKVYARVNYRDENFIETWKFRFTTFREYELVPYVVGDYIFFGYNNLNDWGHCRSSRFNFQPVSIEGTITDLNDWEWHFGLIKDDYRYQFIKAFLEGNTHRLEVSAGAQYGVYESYKGMKIGDYKITLTHDHPLETGKKNSFSYNGYISFEFDVISSNNKVLAPGRHNVFIENGLCITMLDIEEARAEYINRVKNIPATPACDYIYTLRGALIDEKGMLTYQWFDEKTPFDIEYILLQLNQIYLRHNDGNYNTDGFSADEIKAYAKKYFNTSDFVIEEEKASKDKNGNYQIIGRGSSFPSTTILSEEERDCHTVVTVQYWADSSRTVESRRVDYHLEWMGEDFRPLKSVVINDTGFSTSYIGT